MNLGQFIGLIVLGICLYILWEIKQVLLLVFAAVILATALNRLARQLQRVRLPRFWAVLLAIGILLIVSLGFFLLIVPPFAAEFQQLGDLLPKAINRLNQWLNILRTNLPKQFNSYLPDINSLIQQVQPLASRLLGGSVAFVSNTFGGILSFLLVLVLSLMMVAQPLAYRKTFVRLFPSFYRRRIEGILDQCEVALGRWIVGALISMGVVASLSVIGLWALGVRLALAQGVLAGLLNFIPNIGPTLSVVLPMTVALLDAPWKSGAVLILYIIIQQFESNLLTPYVMSQQVALLPAITLMSQVFFATFFGFLGLILALPLTVVAQVWLKEILIKDILDRWHIKNESEFQIADLSESLATIDSVPNHPILPEQNPQNQQESSDE